MMPHRFPTYLLAFLALSAPCAARAQQPDALAAYVRQHYVRSDHLIPMRDGARLYTVVYAPKDAGQTYPILLTRTPYSVAPYDKDQYRGSLGPNRHFAREGYVFVYQDVRGRYLSEGTFVNMRPQQGRHPTAKDIDESTDTYDTIAWLLKHVPNHNGKVGLYGISYPGFYAAAGMINAHPALQAVSPQAPIADWFVGDDFHHNGTFYLAHAFGFFSGFGQKLEEPTREQIKRFDFKTPDGYDFFLNMGPLAGADERHFKGKIEFWDQFMAHGDYDDFWRSRNLRPHLKNVKAAVMTVGGWFDAEDLFGTLATFRAVASNNPDTFNMLVMGPWHHGGWSRGDGDRLGNVNFHAKTAEFYRKNIELRFLRHFLKDDKKFDLPKAYVFETGTDQWRRYDAWPPKNSAGRSLYLHAGARLSFDPPRAEEKSEFDEYVSDPAKPVPYIPNISAGMTREHMVDDQRFASSRLDVLVYQTDVLDEDVTIAGPITASLQISTMGTDSDFVVKLIDVYSGDYPNPDPNPTGVQMGGYQQLVRGEAMRGKFRNSFEKPEPFEPGKLAKIEYVLPDIDHTFRRGHRIMVHVQSSWFPLVDRNPQKFCDIYHARADDFQKTTQRVYHSPQAASLIRVNVLTPAAHDGTAAPH